MTTISITFAPTSAKQKATRTDIPVNDLINCMTCGLDAPPERTYYSVGYPYKTFERGSISISAGDSTWFLAPAGGKIWRDSNFEVNMSVGYSVTMWVRVAFFQQLFPEEMKCALMNKIKEWNATIKWCITIHKRQTDKLVQPQSEQRLADRKAFLAAVDARREFHTRQIQVLTDMLGAQ